MSDLSIRSTDASTDTESKELLRNFATLSSAALGLLKQTYRLHMTASELQFCRNFFRSVEKRAFSIEELRLLDAIAEGNHMLHENLAIASLYVDDERLAETYKDLLEKHRLLYRDRRDLPPTLDALASTLQNILYRSGRPLADEKASLCLSDPFFCISAVSRGYTGREMLYTAEVMPSARVFAVNGEAYFLEDARSVNDDVLLYLENPYFNTLSLSEYTDNPFLTMVERIASTEAYRKAVHAARAIDYRGILYALSTLSTGIYTELRALGNEADLADFAKIGHGGLILSVERSLADALAATIEAVGLTATRVARAIPGNRVTVRMEGGAPYSCLTALLYGVGELSPQLVVTMPKEPTAPHAEVGLFSEAPRGDLLPRMPEIYPSPLSDGFSYTAFSLDSPDFSSVIRQALSVVYRSVVGGVKPMAAYAVCTYPTEVNSTSIGKVLSTMLGLYRVFAELSVPMQITFVRGGGEGCSVFLRGKSDGNKKISTGFTGAEHPVYLLYPRSSECGFPDFSDVRAILSQIQKNSPIAASVHCGESIASAVVSMCASHGIRYAAQLSGGLLGETIDLPYLIVECAEEIPSLPLLGNVGVSIASAEETVEDSDAEPHLAPPRALTEVSSPKALLFSL